ncbi:AEC family transporter [Maritimibacter fusiformis]|uniref:AEC family transporter n=1 Tax=Maritimibacter fusiformis TaxID=2603819 RepID=A0A5D0RN05_9RHOB|nr:AEC family transporter [Maritimibacter fusiformis]TYB82018.1 AEC family transporter [Maritimibacter fusiformis]
MFAVLTQTAPFFALIGLGYGAGRTGFFSPSATAALTRFVFYFALSAMLFRFSANLQLGDVFDWSFVWAYLAGTGAVYLLVTAVALIRGRGIEEAAVEAQCGVIGNSGFLGIPLLAMLMGEAAIGPVMMVLAVDLVVFGSLIVILITGHRDGRISPRALVTIGKGLMTNPMIVSIVLGFTWSATGMPLPGPVNQFMVILGAAATPGALFAIGASLATKSAERLSVAAWLSTAKLVLHPAAVAVMALLVFPVEPFAASVMIAAAALPVAGNVYILAQHYGVAPQRVSASILVSTAVSILTVSAVIAWVSL